MTNREVAKLLREVAAALTIKEEGEPGNNFKILAYEKAAESVENSLEDVEELVKMGKMVKLEGIGGSVTGHLRELFEKGKVEYFEKIKEGLPQGMFPLLEVSGFGPKKAYKLVTALKLKDEKTVIADVHEAGKAGKIAVIPGFGERSQNDILRAIEAYQKGQTKKKRVLLPQALQIGEAIVSYLKKSSVCLEVETLGSLPRKVSTIGDIDLAVSTNNFEKVIDYFIKYPQAQKIIEKGPIGASLLLKNGVQADLRVSKPENFGSMLQYFTGSKAHNIHLREVALKQGWSLSEYGVRRMLKPVQHDVKFKNEEQLYKFLKMDWIAPELREDKGEIEAGLNHDLPKLVDLEDIRGDLHIHSSYDLESSHDVGGASMEEILKKAEGMYSYFAFSEHNPSVSMHDNSTIYTILVTRREAIEQLKLSSKSVRVINLLEVDILTNGELAINNKSLETLDGAIASVHSSFRQSREVMTARILKALANPVVRILGHPTGRLLGSREPIEADWEKIFRFCAEHHKALEINSSPARQDLPDELVRRAVGMGIKLVIDSDSHGLIGKKDLELGICMARRGWAKKSDILNTMEYNEISKFIKERR